MKDSCELAPTNSPVRDTTAIERSHGEERELRERYEEQQRRLCCPSCGEEPFID
jgi:hypothetical protein